MLELLAFSVGLIVVYDIYGCHFPDSSLFNCDGNIYDLSTFSMSKLVKSISNIWMCAFNTIIQCIIFLCTNSELQDVRIKIQNLYINGQPTIKQLLLEIRSFDGNDRR